MNNSRLARTKESLVNLYLNRGMPAAAIGELLGCSYATISRDMKKYNIQTRPVGWKSHVQIELSSDQEQVILGGMLGDCGAQLLASNPRLFFSHTVKNSEYLYWKYRILEPSGLVGRPPKSISVKDQTGKKHPQVRFVTKCHPCLMNYWNLIYPKGRRAITSTVLALLKPLGLGVWFGDDGSIDYPYAAYLSTECFSKEENYLIKEWFEVEWHLKFEVKFKSTQSNLPFLYMSGRHRIDKLIETISPMPPSKNLSLERR